MLPEGEYEYGLIKTLHIQQALPQNYLPKIIPLPLVKKQSDIVDSIIINITRLKGVISSQSIPRKQTWPNYAAYPHYNHGEPPHGMPIIATARKKSTG